MPAKQSPPPAYYLDLQANVADNLRAARQALDMTQRALGNAASLARDYVRRIEARQTNVSLHTLCSIASVLGMHPLELLSPPKKDRRP